MSEPMQPDAQEERMLCPGCLQETEPGTHFCSRCGAPISDYAAVGPLEEVLAQRYLFRRVVSGRPRKLTVVGMWLVFVPVLLAMPAWLYSMPKDDSVAWAMHAFLFTILWLVVAALLYKITHNYVSGRDKSTYTDGDLSPQNRG